MKVKRTVYLSGRSDFKTGRSNCAAQVANDAAAGLSQQLADIECEYLDDSIRSGARQAPSLVATYCLSTDSQHNPVTANRSRPFHPDLALIRRWSGHFFFALLNLRD